MPEMECQTVAFSDWHVAAVLRAFQELGTDRVISQEELKRKTGLHGYALEAAIAKINAIVKDSIMARPESETLSEKTLRLWFAIDDLVLWKGKFTFNERRVLGYKLHESVHIVTLNEKRCTIRVYRDGS